MPRVVALSYIFFTLLIMFFIISGARDDSNILYYPNATSDTYICLQNHIYHHSAMYRTVPVFNNQDKPMKCSEWKGDKKLK